MEVRPANEQDGAAVAALWTAAYTDDPRGGRQTPYALADFEATAAAGEVMVVQEGDELAGVVALLRAGVHDRQVAREGELELARLAVAEPYRHRGIARSLVERCIRLASEPGASALVLWSRPAQTDAHRLYLSTGFSRAPDRDDEDENGPRLVFVRRLLPAKSARLEPSAPVPRLSRVEIERFVWTEHALMRLAHRQLDAAHVELAIRQGHAGRQVNDGRAEWLVSVELADGTPFEAIYDHPHGTDETAVRIVSVWRLDSQSTGGATL